MVATPRQQENELLRQRSARALVQLRKIPYTVLEMGTEHACGCFIKVSYPRLKHGGLCLGSTAIHCSVDAAMLWLHRPTHPSLATLGVVTKRPSLPSLAEQGAFSG